MGSSRHITDAQVRHLRHWLNRGASLQTAALKANMDRKSARKYRDGEPLPSERRQPRRYRTRPDPLALVWPGLEEQLQREPRLQAKTLLHWLQQHYPGQFPDSIRRTLERRVRQWKAQQGPAKEVFFRQVHEPGRLSASDFTSLNDLHVTIQGEPFEHLLYHFVLTYSNWEHVTLCFSESFASLSAGLQNALQALGATPQRHRTDRMTLAVHADGRVAEFTDRYRALLAHYGMVAEATNPASGHENGDCEQSHRRFKEALDQALLLRGSREFASREEYERLLADVQQQRNAARGVKVAEELTYLRRLGVGRLETRERLRVKVSRGSTIRVKHNSYSVPARLIGEWVEAWVGVETIEVRYAEQVVQTVPRLRGQDKHRIDYRHVIDWLVRKPGAFARYWYREELYPTTTFRQAYDQLVVQQPGRADREYLEILQQAARHGEAQVAEVLGRLLQGQQPVSVLAVRTRLGQDTPLHQAEQVRVPAVDLEQYDALLVGGWQEVSDNGLSLGEAQKASTDGCRSLGCSQDLGPSSTQGTEELGHDARKHSGFVAVFAGAASAGDARPVRGGGAAGECGVVELCGLPAGIGPAGMSAAAAEPDRPAVEGLAVAAGEELASVGPEASADESGAATACAAERRLCGPSGERAGVRAARFGQDALPGSAGPRVGAVGPARAVHDVRSAGARVVGGQARPDLERFIQATESMGGVDHRRPGLRATQPGGDGGSVPVVGGALRAGQRVSNQQPAVLEVGADLQGPDDDSGGGGPIGASQRHRGTERGQLPGRSSEARQSGGVGRGVKEPELGRGPGCATAAVATLRRPPLRQDHAPAIGRDSRGDKLIVAAVVCWGMLIVADENPRGMLIVAQGER
jgi:Mu transposase-like protein